MKRSKEKQISKWYTGCRKRKGIDRNNLFKNKEVLFQSLAFNKATISALQKTGVNPVDAKVLDVGCGDGLGLINFIRLGFKPENLTGIDILEERITAAKRLFPNIKFICGDAANMYFPNHEFDIVTESTMFVQITDDLIAQSIGVVLKKIKHKNV